MTRPVRTQFNERAAKNFDRLRIRDLERRINAVRFMPVVFDGGGSELSTGVWGDVPVHFDGTILGWRLLSLDTGSIEIDIWKTDYADFPPDVTDTITGTDLPTISGDVKNESAALTGWDTSLNAGDTLRFNIDSIDSITKVTLTLEIQA